MDARQMQIEFERLLHLANPDFIINNKIDSDTIFYFLNAAQERFIKLNYMSLDSLKNTVENLRKNTDAFKALIVNKTLEKGIPLESGLYGQRFELPSGTDDKFFLYLRSHSYVYGTYLNIPKLVITGELIKDNSQVVANQLITQDEVDKILVNYYDKPILRQPFAVLESDNNKTCITVYTDVYTNLVKCNITYIRKPKKFNIIIPAGDTSIVNTCELDSNVHLDLVELAFDMFITEGAYKLAGGKLKLTKESDK